jgi:hypothetical protein
VSARRWGIGLVTVGVAFVMALSSVMATIVLLYELCDTGQHGPDSTADRLCESAGGAVAFIAYVTLPTLAVVAGGIAGIKTQRWRMLWLGLGVGLVVLVVAGLVMGNVDTGL